MAMRGGNGGFTLYEMIVTMMLVAILVTLALPSFAGSLARSRQTTEINALFHAFHVARKTSITRREVIALCPSEDGRTCKASNDCSAGWLVFNNADSDSPPQIDPDEIILASHPVEDSLRITANRDVFVLRATHKRATNGTFVACDRAGRIPAKALIISYTGRPRVATERPDGTPFQCAD
jgi:type IV fimbrial biogenesis protein FimT